MPAKPPTRGKAVFALLIAATLAALGWILYALGGDQMLAGMLAQTQNVDAQGYLSEYDARMGHLAQPEATPAAPDAGRETDSSSTDAGQGVTIVAPAKPQTPQSGQ